MNVSQPAPGRVAWIAACLLASSGAGSVEPPAVELIITNAKVFSAVGARRGQAIAIARQRIVAVGSAESVQRLAGADTRVIDARHKLVIPGFNDAHYHFAPRPQGHVLKFSSMEPGWPEVLDSLKAAVREAPAGRWIFGDVGQDVMLHPDATREALDAVAPDHPVILAAYYGHGRVINSAALQLLDTARGEPDPLGGRYERLATNDINGRVWEYAEWKSRRVLAAQVSDAEAVEQLRGLGRAALRFGITSMQIMPSMPIERFVRLLERADLPVRVRAIPFAQTTPAGRDLNEQRQLAQLQSANPKIAASGIKWVLDGTPLERGAALRREYRDRAGWRGRTNFDLAEVQAMLRESNALGQQLLLHSAGDRTSALILDAMESVDDASAWPARRVRIEHGDGMLVDLVPRARKLGVVVVQNPAHFADRSMHARWGHHYSPLRSLIDAGVFVAIGSDNALNPFVNILFAATHAANPSESITRAQAVHAYTYGSAFAEFMEAEKGTIAQGQLADLAILSQDILEAPASALSNVSSVLTVVAGKIEHEPRRL